jgi:bifunctional non-homologous end joining protein LigD
MSPSREAQAKRKRRTAGVRLPAFVPPSLATLRANAPSGKDWLHEIKLDGYRIEARLDRGKVQLLTRNCKDWTSRFTPIADAVAVLRAETALLDGELVAENQKGISNFALLQTDMKNAKYDRLVYYAFDLLHLDGRDFTKQPLIARKAALERLFRRTDENSCIRLTEYLDEDGATVLQHACDMGLEGVVSKRREASYRSGRSENFIKSKCHSAQEFIVVGFSPSTAQRAAVGALSVAVRDSDKLRYVGRVGTGYTRRIARELWQRLEKLRTSRPPVALPADERRKNVIWVKPQVVVEVEYRGWTDGQLLRQASYKGLREDKSAKDVVLEKTTSAGSNVRGGAAR